MTGRAGTSSGDGRVTAVIVNYRTPALARECIAALRAEQQRLGWLSAIIVDGGSGDGSDVLLDQETRGDRGWLDFLPLPINGGYGWANNQAILHALQSAEPPEFILLLNPDAQVMPGAIEALRDHMAAHPDCGAAGSQLISPEGDLQVSAFRFPSLRSELAGGAQMSGLLRLLGEREPIVTDITVPTPVDWVPGAGVLIRSAALRRAGLFDDGFFLYFEEVELMWRIKKAGFTVWSVPDSRIMHIAGAATGVRSSKDETPRTLPDYWFNSHRRLIVKMMGPRRARLAAALWLCGRAIGAARMRIQPGFARRRTAGATQGFRRAWRRDMAVDDDGRRVDWQSPPGAMPRWMDTE